MKAKERHELTTNELAEALGRWVKALRPYVSHVLIAVVIVVAAVIWLASRGSASEKHHAEARLAFVEALQAGGELRAGPDAPGLVNSRIQSLEGYLTRYPDSPLRPLAEMSLASWLYNRALLTWGGAGDLLKADDDLTRAEGLYTKLAGRADHIGPWSRLGLACVVYERGNKKEAEGLLLAVARDNPGSDVEVAANERLACIRQAAPLKFAEPKPAEKTGGGKEPGKPGPPPKPAAQSEPKAPEAKTGGGAAAPSQTPEPAKAPAAEAGK